MARAKGGSAAYSGRNLRIGEIVEKGTVSTVCEGLVPRVPEIGRQRNRQVKRVGKPLVEVKGKKRENRGEDPIF